MKINRKAPWQEEAIKDFSENISSGDLYRAAMVITEPLQARRYFEAIVRNNVRVGNQTREEAEKTVRSNLGYFAGYYDNETRLRVEKLFSCQHPVFGATKEGFPSPEDAFRLGQEMAEKFKQDRLEREKNESTHNC